MPSGVREYFFHCTGGFDVDASLRVDRDCLHNLTAFVLPDGRRVDLFVGLRVTSADGHSETYVHSTDDMAALGFYCQDYDELEFRPVDHNNQNPEFKEEWED